MCTMCVPSAQGGQKKLSDPLKLELWKVVNHSVVVGNSNWVLWKSSKRTDPSLLQLPDTILNAVLLFCRLPTSNQFTIWSPHSEAEKA